MWDRFKYIPRFIHHTFFHIRKGNPPFPPFAEEFCEALFDQLPESSPSLGFPMPFRADIEAVIISDDSHLRSFQYWQLSKMSESAPGQKTHRDNNQHQKSTFPNQGLFMGCSLPHPGPTTAICRKP